MCMSIEEKKKHPVPKAIRVKDEEWAVWGNVAEKLGLTRSAFIKQATANAVQLVLAGGLPYFVGGPKATTQNTRTNISDPLSAAKGSGNVGAGDRRRRRGVAKIAEEEATKKRGPKG